ncbi:MAG: hypothetical protein U0L97_02785 [Candidatus Saccharimonadaceae bacterium]|nr:hypothetical protein [Candidatus Saccharimonadaceae bacterium]
MKQITFKDDIIAIYRTERGILLLIIINLLLSIGLLVFSLINLNSSNTVVKTGYGDIGGYRDGSWVDMLSFPLLAVIFGVLHGLLSLRIFRKRGGGMAKFFLLITTTLIAGTFLVLIRLLGEG